MGDVQFSKQLLLEAKEHIGPGTVWQWTNGAGVNLHELIRFVLEAREILDGIVEHAPCGCGEYFDCRAARWLRGEMPKA